MKNKKKKKTIRKEKDIVEKFVETLNKLEEKIFRNKKEKYWKKGRVD